MHKYVYHNRLKTWKQLQFTLLREGLTMVQLNHGKQLPITVEAVSFSNVEKTWLSSSTENTEYEWYITHTAITGKNVKENGITGSL